MTFSTISFIPSVLAEEKRKFFFLFPRSLFFSASHGIRWNCWYYQYHIQPAGRATSHRRERLPRSGGPGKGIHASGQQILRCQKSSTRSRTRDGHGAQRMPVPSNLQGTAMESNLQKVLDYLKSGMGTVGIVGMGGVGKTCLLKEINRELIERGDATDHSSSSSSSSSSGVHFDHIIWVVVSRDASPQKVKEEIVNFLKLPAANDVQSRRNAIFNFLDKKRFLLLLDDVWGHLDLDEIGIPNEGGRTVIFTTRSKEVCGQMEAGRHVVEVACLNEEEAWCLFEEKVGKENIFLLSRPEILTLAKEISNECKGLPLALITIGRAMSAKSTPEEWRHARDSIRNSRLYSVIPEAQETLFPLLKYSYDSHLLHESNWATRFKFPQQRC